MNSKKIILSIFVIFAIIFMAANVFAYTTKGSIPNLANTNKGNIFNLKINEITYTKYSEPQTVENMGNRLYCGHIDIKTSAMTGNSRNLALSILISRPFNDKSIYPRYIEEIYLSGLEGKNQFVSRENKKLWLYSPSSNSTDHKIYLYEEELCSAETLDVYIFKPYYPAVSRAARTGLFAYLGVTLPVFSLINLYNFTSDSVFENYQEKVYVHHYKRALLNQGYVISAFDLKKDASKLYNINNTENSRDGDAYFYNVDYAYGVTFSSSNPEGAQEASPNATAPATAITLSYSKLNPIYSGKIEGYRDLSINAPIELVNDGLCTNSDYPYHLRIKSTTGIDTSETYIGFVGPNTFSANKKDILDLIYNLYVPSQIDNSAIEYLTVSNNLSLIKADKFNLQKNGLNQIFCLSKSFAGKKLNIFVWQSKDAGYKINMGWSDGNVKWTIPEIDFNNLGYLNKINYEFGYVTELQIPTNPFSSGTPPAEATPNEGVVNNGESSDSSEGDSAQPENQPEPVASQPINLDFSVFSSISDISYSTTTTTQYKARTVETPESFLIDYKSSNKNIFVNLSGFSTGPVYAIIAKPDQVDKIYGYLAKIKSTGEFEGYVQQNAFTVDATNLTSDPAAMQYTLGADKIFKFTIAGNATEKLVLIFMQKSSAGLNINLAYTNLYNLDYSAQSTYQLCEINRRIVSFYCTGYNCKLPVSCIDRWDFDPEKLEKTTGIDVGGTQPGTTTPPADTTPPAEQPVQQQSTQGTNGRCSIFIQKSVEEYIECLRRNIEIIDLTKRYALVVGGKQKGSPILGNSLIDGKYNTNQLCYTSKGFNEAVFTGAKKAKLTEEETAQLWSRLAAESSCNVAVGCGDYCDSHGVSQINIPAWNSSNSYNSLKKYLIEIDSSKYDTFSKYQSQLNTVSTNVTSAVEISIAINKYHKSVILNKSRNATRRLLNNLDMIYDHDDSIDMEFATAYAYTGVKYAGHFTKGITKNDTRYQGVVFVALHKMGYYLSYKRMIYQCNKENINNEFVKAYKSIYGGQYCK